MVNGGLRNAVISSPDRRYAIRRAMMLIRPILAVALITTLATSVVIVASIPARAQDKGSVNPKPLPPLANPNDPHVAAKELFGRKLLPAALPAKPIGFYAHGCIAGAVPLPINGPASTVDASITRMPSSGP